MGVIISPSDVDPLDFMTFAIEWHRVEVILNPHGNWGKAMHDLGVKASSIGVGRMMLTMAREDEMTDSVAYYSVRCENPDDAWRIAKCFNSTVEPDLWERPVPFRNG